MQFHSAYGSLRFACRESAKPVPSPPPHHLPTGPWGEDPPPPVGPYQGHVQSTWCCCAGPPTKGSALTLVSPHDHESGGSSWHLPSHRPDHCCLWTTWAVSSLALLPALHGQRRSSSALNSCQRSPLDPRAVLKPESPSRASLLPLTSPASNQAKTMSL